MSALAVGLRSLLKKTFLPTIIMS